MKRGEIHRYVGQVFAGMGDPGPQLNTVGSIEFFLGWQLAEYKR